MTITNESKAILVTVFPIISGHLSSCIHGYTSTQYKDLKTPALTPPPYIYDAINTSLYGIVGAASYLVYKTGEGFLGPAKLPLTLYGANMAMYMLAPTYPIFSKNLNLSLFTGQIITATAIITGYSFYKINQTAGYLYLPFTLWLGFCTVLTSAFIKSNQAQIVELIEEEDNDK